MRHQPAGDGPLDVLAANLQFADILEPHGFTFVGTNSEGRQMWKGRPQAATPQAAPAACSVTTTWP
ncbi:hypothetical protein FE633_17715 [Streptomyces montanus]|uniref:Uncharacterized protein n=1 Tax=Streptomyces montanus TaxID=2580423 RepID=A0A5R9FSA6_9ACTN|nr:hypothetical protein [Streptomyces montanus]TLS44976.1 hypothetical protein FE633_17715 [Streptomyces montanus]